MTASYRSIDYSIRPAKFAERRMLAEAFRRLSKFATIESYQYVGFGSIWFSDFTHFHRALGIERMISIEREAAHSARFEFNKPFRGIEMRFGESAAELPKIDWSLRSIVWLDYDDPLNKSMLADLRTIALAATSGSVVTISVQAETPPLVSVDTSEGELRPSSGIDELKAAIGVARVPSDAVDSDMRGWKLARLLRQALLSEIEDCLSSRNSGRPQGQWIDFRQIGAWEYADGAKMTTISGVFVDRGQASIFASCAFEELSFYRPSLDAMRIEVPKLTPKEMRDIETRLPLVNGQDIDPGHAPLRDARQFATFYRYLPAFASFEP
ncbi:O-methyltransferase [Methylobacterium nodulans]|uniref:Uncharacterized protein n=1 Tax=Methylobacterium nodulans (strain LMG 21967 / CNCM I-2342 / ORS 2060) TaxID=460265 RepID=B8ISH8_METNO|nr:O-methyltransferase [Methylobacterium nodulans]ACL58818.1 conserved hypothetical protein [Methylobacterium nodulans ORS 2060]